MAENNEILLNNQNEQFGEKFERKNEKPIERMVDLKKDVIIPREVQSWLEKVERDPDLNRQDPNNDDSTILQPIATTVAKVTLPTDKRVFSSGFSKTVSDAGRWLSTFVFRLIKKNKGNVKFNEE
jgi:hypothetical protein